jgi:hypothetical protein
MVFEVTSIIAFAGGASVAQLEAHRKPGWLRDPLLVALVAGLFTLAMLGVSGFLRSGEGFWAVVHAVAGHLMLPLVATAAGLWFGASFPGILRRPVHAFPRLFFLLLLCFSCLSNSWTGYSGPSRITPQADPETHLRFQVIHRWVVPLLIGTLLSWWLFRLVTKPSGPKNTEAS